jgi:hypothetical protein
VPQPERHCKKCTPKKVCGEYHLYVIELKKGVLKEPIFLKKNPHLPEGYKGRCFYVGQSKHTPECRYKQHLASEARRRRESTGFLCSCFSEEEVKRRFTPHNRSGKFVRQYHKKGGLRPVFYKEMNPVSSTKEDAEKKEKVLAETLRSLGYAVHSA